MVYIAREHDDGNALVRLDPRDAQFGSLVTLTVLIHFLVCLSLVLGRKWSGTSGVRLKIPDLMLCELINQNTRSFN